MIFLPLSGGGTDDFQKEISSLIDGKTLQGPVFGDPKGSIGGDGSKPKDDFLSVLAAGGKGAWQMARGYGR